MNKRFGYFLIIFVLLVCSSCSSKIEKDVEKLPGIDISVKELNSRFVLEADPGMPNVHKNGEALGFLIRNRSANTITFPKDFGVKILKKQGTVWVPIENKWGYPEGENILPTTKVGPTGLAFFVFPEVSDLKSAAIVRIVVIGHLTEKPSEQAGAFIDVQYK